MGGIGGSDGLKLAKKITGAYKQSAPCPRKEP